MCCVPHTKTGCDGGTTCGAVCISLGASFSSKKKKKVIKTNSIVVVSYLVAATAQNSKHVYV